MNITHVYFKKDSFGITLNALKMLAEALAAGFRDKLVVVQVATDERCCAFFVLNFTKCTAIYTGDGFRTDGGGEGGAGYKTAKALLTIHNFHPYEVEEMRHLGILGAKTDLEIYNELLRVSNILADEFDHTLATVQAERSMNYLR